MEYTAIPRTLWSDVMNALPSPDPQVRDTAYTRLLAAGPLGWEHDLTDPDDAGFDPVARPTIPPGQ
jgi:hypothetical protein